MTKSLKELLAEKEALDIKIAELRSADRAAAIEKIRTLLSENALTQEDIFPASSSSKVRVSSGVKVAAKYRDPVSGKTWTGRGKAPVWLAGRDKAEFLIP